MNLDALRRLRGWLADSGLDRIFLYRSLFSGSLSAWRMLSFADASSEGGGSKGSSSHHFLCRTLSAGIKQSIPCSIKNWTLLSLQYPASARTPPGHLPTITTTCSTRGAISSASAAWFVRSQATMTWL